MVGPQQIPFGEVAFLFICQEHSVFHSYRSTSVSLFLELYLAFVFRLNFYSDLVISFHQGVVQGSSEGTLIFESIPEKPFDYSLGGYYHREHYTRTRRYYYAKQAAP
jgi:hypothetical protein